MKFYKFTYDHIGGKTYPWANDFGPLKEMPFFDSLPKVLIERKLRSWEVHPMPPGIEIESGGRIWSDTFGCGAGSYINFVSENLLRDLHENGIPILRATEMPIARILGKSLQKTPPPKYYVLEAAPGLEVWTEKISVEEQIAARKEVPSRLLSPYRWKCRSDSWNGFDIVSPSNPTGSKMTTSLYCTDRVKELAVQKGWTNVKFESLEIGV
jgi:hypothetical protein